MMSATVAPPKTTRRPTWKQLIKAEPELANLLEEAQMIRTEPGRVFCANACWYGHGGWDGFKPRLEDLVGWSMKGHPLLGTSQAWDVAYERIYAALPDCRGDCWCI